ncbi:ThiF family adenylyltransferase [Delftia tsuruhatensis]|uniref:ThiF family adenylyltransferase n=1 Tax=Delftia tsuruhatensis TaxID=180282 RepID=UPI002090FC34|nr:ThiF family adenylyltransferase [Delftia tsuruhatensis]MCO5340555.1 Mov34/MPN/PAD-1 family protein [Delftia tsuruhatensis]MCR4547890.1 Mov34/MPN/PAD-1 family protein [Delftia tsuruhatensis]
MTALDDAIDQLRRHRGISRVGDPEITEGDDSGWVVEIDVPVELPSRARSKGISATGVKAIETCTLAFHRWPLQAPRPYLRPDFPRDLPHINPHREGNHVPPCVFEGSLDELLHRLGLDAVIDQIIDWLGKAASGTLIDLSQGWEPTRRDSCPSTVEFSAERLIAATPADGTVLTTTTNYITVGDGVYCRVLSELAPHPNVTFTQVLRGKPERQFGSGVFPAFIARAAVSDGQFPVVGQYQPDTVVDLPSLLDLAAALGIHRMALETALSDYYRASVLGLQNYKDWKKGLLALVVLVVRRPARLVGSADRDVEVLPYVVRYNIDSTSAFSFTSNVHAAFHSHTVSPELLARTSGLPQAFIQAKTVLIGCGSLGSKIGMHLARAGIGHQTFVDNEVMTPHNFARHALLEDAATLVPYKAEQMRVALGRLSHVDAKAYDLDAVDLFRSDEKFAEVVPAEAALIIETTASLQVLIAASVSAGLNLSSVRLARAALFGQGRCAVLILEAEGRKARVDDITAFLFELCRWLPDLRAGMTGTSSDPRRIFVGDNCRSLTTPMADALISRSASMIAIQAQKWVSEGKPLSGQLCVGLCDPSNIGSSWNVFEACETTVLDIPDDGGWQIRVLGHIAQAIDEDAKRWGRLETGGALVGRVSYETRTITIAGMVAAPPDSVRSEAAFILGTQGLTQSLTEAHAASAGHLMFVGTWHSHPMGGNHSGIDKDTLRKIATDGRGLPAISLVWTPQGLICAVDRW